MEKREILIKIIEKYAEGNKSKFARMIGVSHQNIDAWLRRNSFNVELISTKCRNINPLYVMTGEGEMLLTSSEPSVQPSTALESLLQQMQQEVAENNKMMRDQMKTMQDLMHESLQLMKKSQEYYERALELASQPQDAPRPYFPLTQTYLAENRSNVSPPAPNDD